MADSRLRAVYDAASRLFISRGFPSTQVSHIAEAANIATGTVYNLFAGKKAILHFVLLSTLDKHYLDGKITLPIQEVDHQLIVGHLRRILDSLFAEIAGEPSFEELFATLFDYTANYQVAFNIINDNRSALPEVEHEYRQAVNKTYRLIETHLRRYIAQGDVRSIELPELHIRNMIEMITWWSMYLPYQAPEFQLPVRKAKEIALDILRHAYLKSPERN